MKLVWTKTAIQDLIEARQFIEGDNPNAASELARRIIRAAERLTHNPELGRSGRLRGTRELVIPKTHYFICYRVFAKRLELLRIFHTSRLYPPKI